MAIGSIGSVTFEVSDQMVRTWQQLSRSRKARYAVHDIIDGKQVVQKTGEDLAEVSLSIRLVSDTPAGGVTDPVVESNKLASMVYSNKSYTLVIGGRPFGKFVLESVDETIERTDGQGRPSAITAQVKLREYN